jgi:hypothetical protein
VVHKRLEEIIDEARKFLPIFRGGTGDLPGAPGPVFDRPERRPSPPKPLPKTYQFTPTVPSKPALTGDAVRWRPQVVETVTMIDDIQEILDNAGSDVEAEQLAEAIYIQAERNQDQEMEDALASIERRRPRQFNSGRSRQFSRQNLVSAPKKKRKVSAYSKRFGIELKKLKKLHPRTKVQNLMKRAHRQTRMAMKMKK